MPTVFQVVYKICKENNLQIPPSEKLINLGSLVACDFFGVKKKTWVYKKQQTEFGKEFSVWCYPKDYYLSMKEIIGDWLQENTVPISPVKDRSTITPIQNIL